jgi:hypothetical protein
MELMVHIESSCSTFLRPSKPFFGGVFLWRRCNELRCKEMMQVRKLEGTAMPGSL